MDVVELPAVVLSYHNGELLTGPIFIDLIWYGNFSSTQRTIVSDFVTSLSSDHHLKKKPTLPASVGAWWKTTEKYYKEVDNKSPSPVVPKLSLGGEMLDESYSLGKRLTSAAIASLAATNVVGGGGRKSAGTIKVVLTSSDVAVDGFCMSRCGTHGSTKATDSGDQHAYIWVGNSVTQCPGHCAWPFHQPIYGPQTPPLVAPNGDVGIDGMVINLAGLLASTVTNPFGNGYFQNEKAAPLEVASACSGVYGSGAYPGYAGNLLVDDTTDGSYNAEGDNGRKFLLPAVLDPTTKACSTLH